MIPGLFGYSLIFELLVLYMVWQVWVSQWSRHWFYLLIFILVLLSFVQLTPGAWVNVFSGDFGFILDDFFRALGV